MYNLLERKKKENKTQIFRNFGMIGGKEEGTTGTLRYRLILFVNRKRRCVRLRRDDTTERLDLLCSIQELLKLSGWGYFDAPRCWARRFTSPT